MRELRILPLLASGTEIVHALGLSAFQVGRSHECDYPEHIHRLPVCTAPVIAVNGSSREIDDLVKQRVANALSVYEVNSDLIASLKPTHIITQTQCKVCAVSLEDVENALQKQTGTNAKVISLEPYALQDVWTDILRVGTACGYEDQARQSVAQLNGRLNQISAHAKTSQYRPRVAVLEWLEPLMCGGNWVPELVELAGAENLFGAAGLHSPWMTWEELVRAEPDVIVALPCGFDLSRTQSEMYWLADRPGWHQLKAVAKNQVYICDGNQFMNRPGPRLIESLQIFAEIFHPARFPPTFRGSGWDVFESYSEL